MLQLPQPLESDWTETRGDEEFQQSTRDAKSLGFDGIDPPLLPVAFPWCSGRGCLAHIQKKNVDQKFGKRKWLKNCWQWRIYPLQLAVTASARFARFASSTLNQNTLFIVQDQTVFESGQNSYLGRGG